MRHTIKLLSFIAIAALAGTAQQSSPAANPNQRDAAARHLVREVIANEIKAEKGDHAHWMYLDRMVDPGRDVVHKVVQTNAGDLELLISRNGQPAGAQERQREIVRLRKLASNPAEEQKRAAAEHEDGQKAQRMLKMLPDAFVYRIERTEGERVVLRFWPDPAFHPASREATVFHAMAGTMVLDTKQQRLAAISGKLMSEVKFGWGILGYLNPGGSFAVKQAEVEPGHWEIAELDVQMDGKALFFKSISLHQKESRSEYRRVPDNLPPEQGVAMLISPPNTVAQGRGAERH
jgi:hypothetical protein